MASIGTILCFHFTSSRSEPKALRLAGAAAVPILLTTLYFTFSRGAILAAAIGLATYIVLGRPRALLSGLLATVPTAAVAVAFSYQADKLAGPNPTSAAATSQGHHVALVVGLCVVGALLGRWLLLALDLPMDRLPLPARSRLPVLGSLAAAIVVTAIVLIVALDVGSLRPTVVVAECPRPGPAVDGASLRAVPGPPRHSAQRRLERAPRTSLANVHRELAGVLSRRGTRRRPKSRRGGAEFPTITDSWRATVGSFDTAFEARRRRSETKSAGTSPIQANRAIHNVMTKSRTLQPPLSRGGQTLPERIKAGPRILDVPRLPTGEEVEGFLFER